MRQLILDLAWDPVPAFAGFLPGDNAAVVAELREQAWPGAPVYLWGPGGAGKTQLLRELQARAIEAGQVAQWFDAASSTPWSLAEDAALVLLDGVDQWSAQQQHAAFLLFVEAASRMGGVLHALADGVEGAALALAGTPAAGARLGVQFVSAGRFPPVDLQVREDLRTRLGWGPVHQVHPLAEAGTRDALRQEARRRGIVLGDEVLDYVLARFARDLKSLMQLLHRLDGFALAEKRAVTVPLLKRMLNEELTETTAPRMTPRRLTLFDLDGTLIPGDSDHAFGEFMVEVGWADGDTWRRRNDEFYATYVAGALDVHKYVEFATSVWRGRTPQEQADIHARFMREVIQPMIHPQALALVKAHQDAGDLVAIVTATNEFVTRPIAQAFGVSELLAIELERDAAGVVTGAIRGVPTYQHGKVTRVGQWLERQDAGWGDFDRITVYSDSINDLPLMERATDPVATNPSAALEAVAAERGWRFLRLFE